MNDESKQPTSPAAAPTVALICGIGAARFFHAQPWTLAEIALVLTLWAVLAPRIRGALVACALMLVVGALRGQSSVAARERMGAFVDSSAESTVVVTGAPVSSWTPVAHARWRGVLQRGANACRSQCVTPDERVTVYVAGERMPPTGGEIRASGALRRSENGRLTLSVKSRELIEIRSEGSVFDPRQWNRLLSERLQLATSNSNVAAVAPLVRAVALGDSAALDGETRRAYRDGGTYHLLVFSGMQIGFAAGALALLLRPLRRPRLTDWAIFFVAIIAPLFAGLETSVVRAGVMLGVFAASRLLRRPTSLRNLLFVSATLRLLFVPADLFEASFHLTFAAAAGLLVIGDALASLFSGRRRIARSAARIAGAELAIAPFTALYFRRIVVGSAVVTLLAAPFVSAMLAASATLLVSLFVGSIAVDPLCRVILLLNDLVLTINDAAAEWLHVSLLRPATSANAFALYAFLLALIIFTRFRKSAAVMLLVLHCVALFPPRPRPVPFTIEALDVGQGDAILVRSGWSAILVDGGGRLDDDNFGDRVLVPLLIDRRITRLDAIAVTHPHPDHCGGLSAVLRSIPVGSLWLSGRQWKEEWSRTLVDVAASRRVPVQIVEHHLEHRIGTLRLHAYTPRLRFKRSAVNNSSVVYRITDGRTSALLTGDIERDAESLLVDEGGDLRSDILKVGHHGSRTSSTAELLDAVRPRIALISCGLHNRYGHPGAEVLERLAERGVRVLRTDLSGSVAVSAGTHLTRSVEFDTPKGGH